MEVSMKTILVDDECIVLKQLRREIEEDICIDLIGSFTHFQVKHWNLRKTIK